MGGAVTATRAVGRRRVGTPNAAQIRAQTGQRRWQPKLYLPAGILRARSSNSSGAGNRKRNPSRFKQRIRNAPIFEFSGPRRGRRPAQRSSPKADRGAIKAGGGRRAATVKTMGRPWRPAGIRPPFRSGRVIVAATEPGGRAHKVGRGDRPGGRPRPSPCATN